MHEDEEMAQCPYDRSHVVLRHRMTAHLMKCHRQNPVTQFLRCPYNSSHQLPASQLEHHTINCEDRKTLESLKHVANKQEQEKKVQQYPQACSTAEYWDEETTVTDSHIDVKDEVNERKMISRLPPVRMSKSETKALCHQETQRLQEITQKEIPSTSSVTGQTSSKFPPKNITNDSNKRENSKTNSIKSPTSKNIEVVERNGSFIGQGHKSSKKKGKSSKISKN